MPTLPERFRAHLDAARLFARPGGAIVAVSGGPDSVALLDLLSEVAPERGLALVVAHADHGIQPGSEEVGAGVAALAERYRLPFELGHLRLGAAAGETVARRARYAWLGLVQRDRGARYLVTAHHQDDQVETILMRVLRGSGPAGLAGIAARGRGGVVRPLLPFTRAELGAHVASRGLAVHQDPANVDPRHVRSWVRTRLVPVLVERLGAEVTAHVLRVGREAAEERRAWDGVLELVPGLALRASPDGFDVARGALAGYDDPVSVALLRAAARRAGLVLGPARARRLLVLARGASGRRVELSQGWEGEAAFDRLRVWRRAATAPSGLVVAGAGSDRGEALFGRYRVRWEPAPAPERLERAAWTTWVSGVGAAWEVRAPRPGDRLRPLGGVGRRPLRRLLMEARVPRSARAAYPVLARGATLVWVPGICRSGDDVPPPGTQAVRVDVTDDRESQADRRA